MPSTDRALRMIEASRADLDLVSSLLGSPSDAEAAMALGMLRGQLNDPELVALTNLRELIMELPEAPFRTGLDLAILVTLAGYEDTGHSYRALHESDHGLYGLEFVGRGNRCERILIHTAGGRFDLCGEGEDALDPTMLALLMSHPTILDRVLEALEHLGIPLEPTFYLSVEDFLSEHRAAAASEVLGSLF